MPTRCRPLSLIRCTSFPTQVLVGPRSSGKTALLDEVLSTLPNMAVYIDGREGYLNSPGALAMRLSTGAEQLFSWLPEKAREAATEAAATGLQLIDPSISAATNSAKALLKILTGGRNADPSDIRPVLEVLSTTCREASKTGMLPAFIIDEANVLTLWRQPEYQTGLEALLRFLVVVRLCRCDLVQGTRLRSRRTCSSLLAQLQKRTGVC